MSFMNPINEPVLRFSSTDVGAPQINYNARVAGDIKALLKSCLVTGYGTKASAGWSAANEAGNVCEFIGPSVAMSDYRLGIDDTSAANTTWYYQYQDTRVNPIKNTISKYIDVSNNTSPTNGWEILVTNQGICFIEHTLNTAVADQTCRLTYWGRLKSALINNVGANICFWSMGLSSLNPIPLRFLTQSPNIPDTRIAGYNNQCEFFGTSLTLMDENLYSTVVVSNVDLISPLYLRYNTDFVAEHPAILLRVGSAITDFYGVESVVINKRPAIRLCVTHSQDVAVATRKYAAPLFIYTDYWEY